MARKLSGIERWIAGLSLLLWMPLWADPSSAEPVQVVGNASIQQNPFVSPTEKQRQVGDASQSPRRAAPKYQNPFTKSSQLPPLDPSLRPGPVSRWRKPMLPSEQSSPIKSAVLAQPTVTPDPMWDQLPSGDMLRQRAAKLPPPSDPAFFDRLTKPEPLIRFAPAPLIQPKSVEPLEVAPTTAATTNPSNVEEPAALANLVTQPVVGGHPALPKAERITNAFAIEAKSLPANHEEISPTIVSDCVDTPEAWLAHAQEAAKTAESQEELTTVIELCNRGIRGDPSAEMLTSLRKLAAWAHNRRGEVYADAQQADEAMRDFQVAITMDSKCSAALHNRAVTLAQRNQFAAALRDFNHVIELNPDLALAYRNRAELLAALDRMDDAIVDYSEALKSMPEDAALLRARAHAYQRRGDFALAAADLSRAIALMPDDPDAFTQRGGLNAEQGNFELAEQDFRKAIAIDANWADAHRSLAWLQATCPDKRFRNPQQALAAAEQAAQLSAADDYLVLDTLAAAHATAGQFERATELQQKAIAAAPRDVATALEQRLALYEQKQPYTPAAVRSPVRTASHASRADSKGKPASTAVEFEQ